MKALVVGYGSIGTRHARLLASLGCDVAIVSRRQCVDYVTYASISDAFQGFSPDYVVLARETQCHHDDLVELSLREFKGIVLVEKPLFHAPLQLPSNSFRTIFVAYNLRFHPLLQKLNEMLRHERILSVQVYAGQYLPDWRQNRDYRQTYSSLRNNGGVLRDLSHELDYILWLFGKWQKVAAVGGHYSHLEIDSDDCFSLLLVTERCPAVTLQLNYLDRAGRRSIIVNTDTSSILLDLVNETLTVNNNTETCKTDRDTTYINQHRAILEGRYSVLCTADEGMQVMQLIQATETAAQKCTWISR